MKKVKNGSINPITGKYVFSIIDPAILKPRGHGLVSKIKGLIKKCFGLGISVPDLYYDDEIDFGFFPRPTDQFINNFYRQQGEADAETVGGRIALATSPAMRLTARTIIDWVLASADGNSSFSYPVDFGSGSGWMALEMHDKFLGKVVATDFSLDAMLHINELNPAITVRTLEDFYESDEKFDFLSSVDVFEHLADPLAVLKKLYNKADEGALVFISVPNFGSYFSKIHLGSHPYFAYPAHLNYYTETSLSKIATVAGFDIVNTLVTTLPWEHEYISRSYSKDIENNTGWPLWDLLMDGRLGERLFLLARK